MSQEWGVGGGFVGCQFRGSLRPFRAARGELLFRVRAVGACRFTWRFGREYLQAASREASRKFKNVVLK